MVLPGSSLRAVDNKFNESSSCAAVIAALLDMRGGAAELPQVRRARPSM